MPNEGLINLVGWCKRERESLQMQREMLQSGKFRLFNVTGRIQERARESLKSHGRWVGNCLRAGASPTRSCHANVRCSRLNRGHRYVLDPVASQKQVPSHNADGRPAQVVDVTLTRRAAGRLQLATI
jgi:hypothetical protein